MESEYLLFSFKYIKFSWVAKVIVTHPSYDNCKSTHTPRASNLGNDALWIWGVFDPNFKAVITSGLIKGGS